VAVEQNPNNPFPHRCLSQLYERAKKNTKKAAEHRKRADELRAKMQNAGSDAAEAVASEPQA
jgi:hypothetical protein